MVPKALQMSAAHLRSLLAEARKACSVHRSGKAGDACSLLTDVLSHLDSYKSWDTRDLIIYINDLLKPLRDVHVDVEVRAEGGGGGGNAAAAGSGSGSRSESTMISAHKPAPVSASSYATPEDQHAHDLYLERYLLPPVPFFQVLTELQSGRKATHWMWWVFPQLCAVGKGVALSATSSRYCFQNEQQAVAYARHSVHGWQYMEAVRAVLEDVGKPRHTVTTLFPNPVDVMKLISSLTLFEAVFGRLGSVVMVGPEGHTARDVSHMITDILRLIKARRCETTLKTIHS